MNKEELTRTLEYTEKKHRHDTVNTFDTDISMMCVDVLRVLKNCIEIPDNATNGDVIKALFPKAEIHDWASEDAYIDIYGVDYEALTVCRKWWDAPYNAESEE